jgi:hypothetical protein
MIVHMPKVTNEDSPSIRKSFGDLPFGEFLDYVSIGLEWAVGEIKI